jgi:hypothetical protein
MTAKHIKITIAASASLIAILITVGNGCSKRADYSSTSSSSGSNNVFEADGNESATRPSNDLILGAKTASVVYAKQALDQLTSCAGVRAVSDDTIRMYDSKEGSISAYGDFNSVTAPMLVAITNISGEVCDDLIDQEVRLDATGTNARIFRGIRMVNSDVRSDSGLYVEAIQKLALSCWHKQASNQEITEIVALLDTVPMTANAASNRRKSLLLCTAVISSLKSLMN